MKTSIRASLVLLAFTFTLLMAPGCPDDQGSGPEDADPSMMVRALVPADGAIVSSQSLTLEWYLYPNKIYFDSATLNIRSDTASNYTQILRPLFTDVSYQIDSLEPATIYHWFVYATGHTGGGTVYDDVSDTFSFTMADYLFELGEPYSPTPDSGAVGVSIATGLTCQVFNPDSLAYDFDIYFGTTTDPPLVASQLVDPIYSFGDDTLEYSTMYYWRVEAYFDTDTVLGPLWQFTTDYPTEVDIFALIEVDAKQTSSGYHVMEEIRARFDTAVAINAPIQPLQADSVFVENTRLDWNATTHSYGYTEFSMPFIENGQPVDVVVYGNGDVPGLSTNMLFPACTLAIVSPESFESVSITGFEVTWDGSECGGTVLLILLDGTDSTGVWIETANDGIDTLTAADLIPLGGQTGAYDLVIMKLSQQNINAPGYSTQSLFRARSYNTMAQINISSK